MEDLVIRSASPEDDALLVAHYLALWKSYGVAEVDFVGDAAIQIAAFIEAGRRDYEMRAFIAELSGEPAGSLACQVEILPYPTVTLPSFRKHGYIWSVFVEAEFRNRGIASALVSEGIAYLKSIGCTKAVLHASAAGESVYLRAGFIRASEMRLDLAAT